MAMGYDVLSMNSSNLLMVRLAIRSFKMSIARAILAKVLTMDNAFLIKSYVEEEMVKAGLSQLVRMRH
jgi:phosphotransferase system enzyme I (PtsP)